MFLFLKKKRKRKFMQIQSIDDRSLNIFCYTLVWLNLKKMVTKRKNLNNDHYQRFFLLLSSVWKQCLIWIFFDDKYFDKWMSWWWNTTMLLTTTFVKNIKFQWMKSTVFSLGVIIKQNIKGNVENFKPACYFYYYKYILIDFDNFKQIKIRSE